ncbi:MAG: GNAT family N-acetyltransferase [Candidatus Acidiferrales bacterium]
MENARRKPKFVFEPLGAQHDRAAFSCGQPPLDLYLRTQARQDVSKNLAAVFVCTTDGNTVAGYYALSQYSVSLDTIPEKLARKLTRQRQVPTTLIGRLARSTSFAGTGLGEILLMDALHRCLRHNWEVASWAVVVDAKDEKGAAFYKKYGFIEIPGTPSRFFIVMATIERLLRSVGLDGAPTV